MFTGKEQEGMESFPYLRRWNSVADKIWTIRRLQNHWGYGGMKYVLVAAKAVV